MPLAFAFLAITRFSAEIGDQTFAMIASPPSPTSEIVVLNDDFVSGLYRDSLYFRVAVEDVAQPGVARFLQLTFSVGAATAPSVLQDDALAIPGGLYGVLMYAGGLLFAFGNQHLGLTQAAISAELVIGLMSGETPAIDPQPYRVDRF